jgi:O-6-methylguanine DNA methyltransferase
MVDASSASGAPAEIGITPAPESVRVLIPSPLGNLALELRGRVATRLLIAPGNRERKHFVPFKEMLGESDFLDEVVGRFSEYFAGARRDLRLEVDLDPARLDPFARRVLTVTSQIPYGETRTYQEVAVSAGDAEAYRAVRAALMANPVPILIPCHRVLPQKGGPGSYIAGTKRKATLLRLEEQAARQSS